MANIQTTPIKYYYKPYGGPGFSASLIASTVPGGIYGYEELKGGLAEAQNYVKQAKYLDTNALNAALEQAKASIPGYSPGDPRIQPLQSEIYENTLNVSGLGEGFGKITAQDILNSQLPQSQQVASWKAPWGETLTNISQTQIDQIMKAYGQPGYYVPPNFANNPENLANRTQPQYDPAQAKGTPSQVREQQANQGADTFLGQTYTGAPRPNSNYAENREDWRIRLGYEMNVRQKLGVTEGQLADNPYLAEDAAALAKYTGVDLATAQQRIASLGIGGKTLGSPAPASPTISSSTYTGTSIVDYLKSIGQASDINSRIALGKQYGIDYSKSKDNYATENTQLLNILRGQTSTSTTSPITPSTTPSITPNPAIKSRDLIIEGMPITVPGASGNVSYKIASGDTLTTIAKKFGTTIDAIMKANNVPSYVANPVIPGAGPSPANSTDESRAADDAAKAKVEKDKADTLKKAQDDLIAANTEAQRLAAQKAIQDLKTSMGINEAPKVPTYESDYKALIAKEGITGLQSQINTINTEMNTLEANYKVGKAAISNELAPMDLLTTRQQQLADQYNSQLDSLNNRKKTLVDEYNLKVSNVNALMDMKKMDYEAAKSAYDSKFNQAISLMTATNTLENTTTDNARANWSAIMSNMKGVDYASMSNSMKANIQQLETQMGLPLGITNFIMDNMTEEEDVVSSNIIKDENDNPIGYSVLYKDADGNLKTKTIGISGVSTGTGMGSKSTIYDTPLIKELTSNPNVDPMTAADNFIYSLTYTPTESERKIILNRAQELSNSILTLDEVKAKIDEGRKANIGLNQMLSDIDSDWRILDKQAAKDYARSVQASSPTNSTNNVATTSLPKSYPTVTSWLKGVFWGK